MKKILALAAFMACGISFADVQGPLSFTNNSDYTVMLMTADETPSLGQTECTTTIPPNDQLIGSIVPAHTVGFPVSYNTSGQIYSIWAAFLNYDDNNAITTMYCQCTPQTRDPVNGQVETHDGGCLFTG